MNEHKMYYYPMLIKTYTLVVCCDLDLCPPVSFCDTSQPETQDNNLLYCH